MGGIADIVKKHKSELQKGITEPFEHSLVHTPYEITLKDMQETQQFLGNLSGRNIFRTMLLVVDTYVAKKADTLTAYSSAKQVIRKILPNLSPEQQKWMYILS